MIGAFSDVLFNEHAFNDDLHIKSEEDWLRYELSTNETER